MSNESNVGVNVVTEGTEVSKKREVPSMSASNFVRNWQKCKGSVDMFVQQHGGNPAHWRHRANTLIKKGVPLVQPIRKSGGGSLNLEELAAIANEYNDVG